MRKKPAPAIFLGFVEPDGTTILAGHHYPIRSTQRPKPGELWQFLREDDHARTIHRFDIVDLPLRELVTQLQRMAKRNPAQVVDFLGAWLAVEPNRSILLDAFLSAARPTPATILARLDPGNPARRAMADELAAWCNTGELLGHLARRLIREGLEPQVLPWARENRAEAVDLRDALQVAIPERPDELLSRFHRLLAADRATAGSAFASWCMREPGVAAMVRHAIEVSELQDPEADLLLLRRIGPEMLQVPAFLTSGIAFEASPDGEVFLLRFLREPGTEIPDGIARIPGLEQLSPWGGVPYDILTRFHKGLRGYFGSLAPKLSTETERVSVDPQADAPEGGEIPREADAVISTQGRPLSTADGGALDQGEAE